MAQVNAGRVRFVSRGEYNNSTQYYLFDLVNYEGSSYVAIGNTLGNIPTNTTYWKLVAEKGNTGSVGPEGPQGVGIASITKTSSEGLVDTYTITYTDGTTSTFQITNGEDGETPLSDFNALKDRVSDVEDNQLHDDKEGTEIYIDDAHNSRVDRLELEKESTQETTTGKNLFDKTTHTIMNTSNTRLQTNGYIALPAGTYTISYTGNINQLYILYYDSNHTKIGESNWASGNVTFTYNQDYEYKFTFRKSGDATVTPSDITNIQIEEGSIATPYEPYTGGQPSPNPDYPQEVKTVKGYRNLFDKDGTLSTGKRISTSTGGLYNATNYTTTNYIDVIENKNYSLTTGISSYFCWYDENKDKISAGTWSIAGGYKTAPENSKYIRFDFLTENINNIQFTESIQELPYVPYGNNYIAVNVSDGNTTNSYPIPLNNNEIVGIGEYKDELLVDKTGHCWLNKKTGKVVLNGSESGWIYNSNSSRPFTFPITNILLPPNNNTIPSILCNYYTVIKWNGTNTNYLLSITSSENNLRFRNVDITSLANFKTWLSTHNTEVYYVLATPELIDLNTKVDLKLFKEVNNVSNSEDGNMRIRYVQDTQLLFNNFDERLKALEEANS